MYIREKKDIATRVHVLFQPGEKISSTFQNLSRINSFHLSTQLEIYTHTTSGDEREFNSCRVMYICIYRAGKRRLASFTIYNDNRRRDRGNTKDPGHLGDCRHFLYSLFIDFIFFFEIIKSTRIYVGSLSSGKQNCAYTATRWR